MVTGVETAGLILATFPLIIKGLTAFTEGVDTFKIWRKYRWQLEEYTLQLRGQLAFYLDTLEELFSDIVDSDDILAKMIRNPGEKLWCQPGYEKKLKTRLDRSYDIYVETTGLILSNLKDLQSRLDLDRIDGISWDRDSTMRREIKRLKLVLSRNIYNELISKIDRHNKTLREFTHQSRLLEPSRRSRKYNSRKRSEFNSIRRYTRSLHDLIIGDKLWKCKCRTRHAVNLGLGLHPTTGISILLQSESESAILTIKETGEKDHWKWQAFNVLSKECLTENTTSVVEAMKISEVPRKSVRFAEPESSPNISKRIEENTRTVADPIHCFCETARKLHTVREPLAEKCIGLLLDTTTDIYQHEIFPAKDLIPWDSEPQSLEAILSKVGVVTASKPRWKGLSRGDRLFIAMTLASSILQVDDIWFKPNFRSGDIVVVPKKSKRNTLLPYLSRHVVSSNDGVPASGRLEESLMQNEALLGLCLTLIELSLGQPLSHLQEPEDIIDDRKMLTDFRTAKRLLPDIFDESGEKYESAVHWCIDSLSKARNCSFEDDTFVLEMLENVVTPLEEDWKNFHGMGNRQPGIARA